MACDSAVQADIDDLLARLAPDHRKLLEELPEDELPCLHFTFGMWLRNQFRHNRFPNLLAFCSAKVAPEKRSFDEISAVAIREIHARLRGARS
jgi:hypothetical protein